MEVNWKDLEFSNDIKSIELQKPKPITWTVAPFGKDSGYYVTITTKPNWIHRKFMTLFFGFYWIKHGSI